MSASRQRFLDLLRRDILELDAAELDFGIYRVLNHRRALLERFLSSELPARIEAELARLPGQALEDEEARLYNALYTFFSRYYDSGDFLPRQRRGKAGRYSVPYDGSDTHFHWATKGSHYVKSGERFASYAYRQPDGTRLRLAVHAADVERDNARGAQRHYLPLRLDAPTPAHPGEWRLLFEHRPLSDDEARTFGATRRRRGAQTSAETPADAEAGEADDADDAPATEGASVQERIVNAWFDGRTGADALPPAVDITLLKRHALRWAKGQSTDFFVHPQLGGFLRDELDHYLQTEFVHLWDLPDSALARERGKLRIAREIGRALIEVLAALEDLQAALFEKRKFVLQAHYLVQCSWLAAQGVAGAALVAQAASHAPQVERWRQWLGEAPGSSASGAELLARCPHLPLDTALFDEAFQYAVLAVVPDLTAALGGVLVHGDNYAALRTLEAGWRQAVKCVYIDPPYNTGGDGFLYKDDYTRHSAWASMVFERVCAARPMSAQPSPVFVSLDDNEAHNARSVIAEALGTESFAASLAWLKRYAPPPDTKGFGYTHESVLAFTLGEGFEPLPLAKTEAQEARYKNPDNDPRGPWKAMDYTRRFTADERPNLFYPVIHPASGSEVWPKRSRVWAFSRREHEAHVAESRLWWGRDGRSTVPALKNFASDVEQGRRLGSVLHSDDAGHTDEAAKELRSLFDGLKFTSKPSRLVQTLITVSGDEHALALDYFAGSGTTAHAVINLNRDDGGSRRFILVEQGEYFDTVTLPRVAKVMACPEWKDGKPKEGVRHQPDPTDDDPDAHWSRRTLPIVQVLRIERYEDSLDALALPGAPAAQQGELAGFDALLRYVADDVAALQSPNNPVRLSTAALARPLDYRLPTVWEGRAVERPVDLLHTTLLLLGLHLVRLRRLDRPAAAGGGVALLAEVRAHRAGQPLAAQALALLLLREHDLEALNPAQQLQRSQAEYDWLAGAVHQQFGRALADYACIHHNRDLLLPGEGERGASIDAALAAAMWQRDPAFSAPAATTAAVPA